MRGPASLRVPSDYIEDAEHATGDTLLDPEAQATDVTGIRASADQRGSRRARRADRRDPPEP
jgi:hypothetical protein